MANELHQIVFDFLETFRSSNPDFCYWFRERNTKGRLDEGLWFQGTENYVFVGLYDRSGGSNMTRSFGFVFYPKDEKIGCSLEVVFNEEKDEKIVDFYHKAVEKIGGFKTIGNTKFEKLLSPDNGFYEAEKFLNEVKPQIDLLINEMSLQDLFITKEKFEKNYNRIINLVNKKANAPNYWVFQGNPKKFEFETAIKEELLEDWTVTAHKDEFKIGDKVILWIVGDKAGCYALAKIISLPFVKESSPDDHLWKEEIKGEWKVNLDITHNLLDSPILWNNIKDNPAFKEMNVGKQGTNFTAKASEYNELIKLIPKEEPLPFNVWLISPGRDAIKWDEFTSKGIISIGWDELGDLSQYNNKEEIRKKLQFIEKTDGSKKNDVTACWEFVNVLKEGDVVIAKKKTNEFLGWGIVTSEYIYDEKRGTYCNVRKVDWKKTGSWPSENIVQKTLTNITKYPQYVKELIALLDIKIFKNMLKKTLNQILFGPPGTGKTYNTINKALEIINEDEEEKLDWSDRKAVKKRFEERINEGRIVFTTFHQSMSYEDFIEGIKPVPPKAEANPVIYKVQNGILKTIVNEAKQTKQKFIKIDDEIQVLTEELFDEFYYQFVETLVDSDEEVSNCILETQEGYKFGLFKNSAGSVTIKAGRKKTKMSASVVELKNVLFHGKLPTYKSYESKIISKILEDRGYNESPADNSKKPFVLIIDEINRGNVSQIFGELITLIEEDKRLGADEALEVVLPYSKEKFGVPSNLYIIGTMNTADRSVEAIDTALRRRFSFEEVPPKYDLKELQYEFDGVKGFEILQTLNKRIEKLLDKDHQIGHSYFMKKNGMDVNDMLLTSFYKNIIPLLQEYFFGDFGKIGLVLGPGFVQKKEWNKNLDSFAEFEYESASEFDDRPVYGIIDHRDIDQVDGSFENAIKILMNRKIV